MAGVDADPHARLVLHLADDVGDMLEAEPDVGALPCRVLDDCRDTLRLVESHVDAFGDAVETLLQRDELGVTARVEIEHRQPQLFAALHLVKKGTPRLVERFGIRLSQVNKCLCISATIW